MARVGRGHRHDRGGRRRPGRRRPPRPRAAPPRRSTPQARQLLRCIQRDGHRHRRRRRRDRAPPPRRARAFRLRGGRALSADRDEPRAGDPRTGSSRTRTRCFSRRTSFPAVPGHPACSSPSVGCCVPRCRRCRPAGRSSSSARRRRRTTRTPRSGRRRDSRDRGIDPGRARVRAERGRRRRGDPAARARTLRASRFDPSRRILASRSSGPRGPSAWPSCRSASASPAGLLHANFVAAVLSDLFGIQARSGCFCAGPYIHRAYPIDDAWSRHMHAEAVRGRLGARLAFTRLSFPYYTHRRDARLRPRRRASAGRRGLEAASGLPLDPTAGSGSTVPASPATTASPRCSMRRRRRSVVRRSPSSRSQLEVANEIVRTAGERREKSLVSDPTTREQIERHRWFALPDASRTPVIVGVVELPVDAELLLAAAVDENEVRVAAGLTMVIGAVAFGYAYFAKQYVPLRGRCKPVLRRVPRTSRGGSPLQPDRVSSPGR